jgi:hypothetical protein
MRRARVWLSVIGEFLLLSVGLVVLIEHRSEGEQALRRKASVRRSYRADADSSEVSFARSSDSRRHRMPIAWRPP